MIRPSFVRTLCNHCDFFTASPYRADCISEQITSTIKWLERLEAFPFSSAEDAISLFVFLDDALEPYRVTVQMLVWLRGFHRSTELRLIQCIPLTNAA